MSKKTTYYPFQADDKGNIEVIEVKKEYFLKNKTKNKNVTPFRKKRPKKKEKKKKKITNNTPPALTIITKEDTDNE